MRLVWKQLNARLLKWVKWEKDLNKKATIKYLQTKYKEHPNYLNFFIGASLEIQYP